MKLWRRQVCLLVVEGVVNKSSFPSIFEPSTASLLLLLLLLRFSITRNGTMLARHRKTIIFCVNSVQHLNSYIYPVDSFLPSLNSTPHHKQTDRQTHVEEYARQGGCTARPHNNQIQGERRMEMEN